jgi:hypothetical protein
LFAEDAEGPMAVAVPVLRRYDLLAAAVHDATRRRLAGDWQGACAAAGVEVDASVLAAAPRMLDDLRNLAPDLLRWHLFDGGLGLAPGVRLPLLLAQHPEGPALVVHDRSDPYRPSRLTLSTDQTRVCGRWDGSRHLWDVRHAARLPQRLGGGDRAPYFHRDGRRLDRAELPRTAPPAGDRAATTEWEDRVRPDDPVAGWRRAQRLPAVPETARGLPWFVWPLYHGQLPVTALHPLVRAAMFPDGPDEPYAPAPGVPVPERVHVQCTGRRHYVGWRAGRLEALSHPPDDLLRERSLRALGGPAAGCLTVLDNWSARTGRLPREIRVVARQLFLAAVHGDAAEVHRLLDAGVDPRGVRGVQRRSLLHVAHRIGDVPLIQRLRAAGLDPAAPDGHGHTAVRVATAMGAPAAILDALR